MKRDMEVGDAILISNPKELPFLKWRIMKIIKLCSPDCIEAQEITEPYYMYVFWKNEVSYGMSREAYIHWVKSNPNITKGELITRFMCPLCNRCHNQKMMNICLTSLDLAIKLWNE